MLKVETETIIRKLRPELQMRLRFISHLSVGEISASSGQKISLVSTGIKIVCAVHSKYSKIIFSFIFHSQNPKDNKPQTAPTPMKT